MGGEKEVLEKEVEKGKMGGKEMEGNWGEEGVVGGEELGDVDREEIC